MSASRLPRDSPADEQPLLEPVPGPVARQRVERRFAGIPARYILLCVGCAALGATVGLFATGNLGWGVVCLLLALIVFASLGEAARQGRTILPEQSSRLAADGRAHAATTAEVWRTRLEITMARRRTQSRLDRLERERPPVLQALGDAVFRGDKQAETEAKKRLSELAESQALLEAERDELLSGADARIRLARLPVQETVMVTPNEPSTPYPPPDEGDPPQPATVPEPYPPPDEGTPPAPAPGPGDPNGE